MGNKFPEYSCAKDADVSEVPTFDLTDIQSAEEKLRIGAYIVEAAEIVGFFTSMSAELGQS